MIKKQNEEIILSEDGKKFLGEFQLVSAIGEGTFGKVTMAIHNKTKEKVAIKLLSKKKIKENKDEERVKREIEVLNILNHANIINLYYVIETKQTMCIVYEYCAGKDLIELLRERKRVKEEEASRIFYQLISAVEYIHLFRISHRDIKLENILYVDGRVKLIDFGLSNFYKTPNGLLSTSCGSPSYAAPEIILGKRYNGLKSDIWSCGIVLYGIVCGFLPFEARTENDLYYKITEGKFVLPKYLSNDLKNLLSAILVTDPNKRLSFEEIKNHIWLHKHHTNIIYGITPSMCPPVDYDILNYIEKICDRPICNYIEDIVLNRRNEYTTLYYLLVKRKLKSKVLFTNNEDEDNLESIMRKSSGCSNSYTNRSRAYSTSLKYPFEFENKESISNYFSEQFRKYYVNHSSNRLNKEIKEQEKANKIKEIINSHIRAYGNKSISKTVKVMINTQESVSELDIESILEDEDLLKTNTNIDNNTMSNTKHFTMSSQLNNVIDENHEIAAANSSYLNTANNTSGNSTMKSYLFKYCIWYVNDILEKIHKKQVLVKPTKSKLGKLSIDNIINNNLLQLKSKPNNTSNNYSKYIFKNESTYTTEKKTPTRNYPSSINTSNRNIDNDRNIFSSPNNNSIYKTDYSQNVSNFVFNMESLGLIHEKCKKIHKERQTSVNSHREKQNKDITETSIKNNCLRNLIRTPLKDTQKKRNCISVDYKADSTSKTPNIYRKKAHLIINESLSAFISDKKPQKLVFSSSMTTKASITSNNNYTHQIKPKNFDNKIDNFASPLKLPLPEQINSNSLIGKNTFSVKNKSDYRSSKIVGIIQNKADGNTVKKERRSSAIDLNKKSYY